MQHIYDVAVIGAGVVGCAIARELAQYDLDCVLIDSRQDVGAGTSKANSAILHTGFDARPSHLEARLLRRGYELLNLYAPQANIPIERLGALIVAWDVDSLSSLTSIRENALQNDITDAALISSDELYQREPHLAPGAKGALLIPGESIICPFTTPIAFATQAVVNGIALLLNNAVQAVRALSDSSYELICSDKAITARYIVNAAGLHSDTINSMFGHHDFTVIPRRGEFIVFDKQSRDLVGSIILPVPSAVGKGVIISPTVFGNVILGPTAENIEDKTAVDTTRHGLRMLLDKGKSILPALLDEEVTASYAGLRASTEYDDYQIHLYPDQRLLCVGGIRSTGLSASMGIAEYAVELLASAGLALTPKAEFHSVHMPNIGEVYPRPYQSDEMIASNQKYGQIVCFCERVTQGEMIDACHSIIPARDLDGLRRRTRAMMGRCQGFFCSAEVTTLLAENSRQSINCLVGLEQ